MLKTLQKGIRFSVSKFEAAEKAMKGEKKYPWTLKLSEYQRHQL